MRHAEKSAAWVLLVAAVMPAVFWRTSWSMAEQWRQSQTYSHGFLVVPIFVWLVWTCRHALSRVRPDPFWPAVLVLGLLGLTWLLSEASATATPSQLAVVAAVPAALATVFGLSWLRVLAFPACMLLFAVPVGDSLVPTLIDWTADFVVFALKLSGVPVYRDGTNFSTPTGEWSVVDSCSGIRYLFACLMVSALYAWIMYRSPVRRVVFVGVALVIAVVANWVRAYGIVMLAYHTNNQVAIDVDHLIYGGVFLCLILGITFAIGRLWREGDSTAASRVRPLTEGGESAATPEPLSPERRRSLSALLVVVTLMSAWPAVARLVLDAPARNSFTVRDIAASAGWAAAENPKPGWQPHLHRPLRLHQQTFEKDGRRVTVHLGIYGRPGPDSKVYSSLNRLVPPDDLHWKLIHRGTEAVRRGIVTTELSTGTVLGPGARFAIWHCYWVDGICTSSPVMAAWRQTTARLAGRSEMTAWLSICTIDGRKPSDAQATLRGFSHDMFDEVQKAIQVAARADMP